MTTAMKALIEGHDLNREAARGLFGRVVNGDMDETDLAALLVALKLKGETAEEIAGAAEALREAAVPFDTRGLDVVDTCGTGGDSSGTFNVSTATAILAAEMGLAVAKHGNRSVSSLCGSADVLERCGARIDPDPAISTRCLTRTGFCFLLAPQYHPGVKHAMGVRRRLGTRTIFNVVGPLANPARPSFQLVGVYDPALCVPMAETLRRLGCRSAMVVHGSGLDELCLHGPTTAARLVDGVVEPLQIEPEEVGLQQRRLEDLAGGDPDRNADILRALLAGRGPEPHSEAVALNTGALLWISGRTDDLRGGVEAAMKPLSEGTALGRLERFVECSHGAG